MKFILEDYINKSASLAATLTKMIYTADSSKISISKEAREFAEDYLEMYNQFRAKLVIDERASIYNGDINYDWLAGPHGNRVQGLLALDNFGRMAQKTLSASIIKK